MCIKTFFSVSFLAKLKVPSKEEPNIDEEGLSHLEILKRKRDYKRRRQSYRAKNVHITQRTTAEVCVHYITQSYTIN